MNLVLRLVLWQLPTQKKRMTYGLIRCGHPQLGLLVLVWRDAQYLMGWILLDIPVTVKGPNILELCVSQIRGVVFVKLGRSLQFTVSIIFDAGNCNVRSPWRVNSATPWIVSARTGLTDTTATTKSFARMECIFIWADEYNSTVILENGKTLQFYKGIHGLSHGKSTQLGLMENTAFWPRPTGSWGSSRFQRLNEGITIEHAFVMFTTGVNQQRLTFLDDPSPTVVNHFTSTRPQSTWSPPLWEHLLVEATAWSCVTREYTFPLRYKSIRYGKSLSFVFSLIHPVKSYSFSLSIWRIWI